MNNRRYNNKGFRSKIVAFDNGSVGVSYDKHPESTIPDISDAQVVQEVTVDSMLIEIADTLKIENDKFIVQTNGDQADLVIDDQGEVTELVK